jgi:hypothetical protein
MDIMEALQYLMGGSGLAGGGWAVLRIWRSVRKNWPTIRAAARGAAREFVASDPHHGNGSMRDDLKDIRTTSRQTLGLVTTAIEGQQDLREEVRALGERVSAVEQSQDDLEGDQHALRRQLDEDLPRLVAQAAAAMASLRDEVPGQIASPTFLQEPRAARPQTEPEER